MARVFSPGSGGKESLRTELASARSKLTSLHQEKEHLAQNMRELQSILDKERKELREVLGSAKAKIDQTDKEKRALQGELTQSETTVREQAARIRELEDLLRQLRAELASGGSSLTAVSSAVSFICSASSVDEVFARAWAQKAREEPAVTVLDALVLKLRSVSESELSCQVQCNALQESISQAEARHAREIADLQRRVQDEASARAQSEAACNEADARYNAVAAEMARNNQEIHSWRTEERLSMERGLAELRAQLEASRGTIDELSHSVNQKDQSILKLEHEVKTSLNRLQKTQTSLAQLQDAHDTKCIELERSAHELQLASSKYAQSQAELESLKKRHASEMNHQHQVHQSEVSKLGKLVQEAEAQGTRLRAEVLRLEHLVQELEAEIANYRAEAAQMHKQLEVQAAAHKAHTEELEQQHHTELSELKDRIQALEAQIARLQADLAHAKQTGSGRASELQAELDAAFSKIDRLERELSEALRMLKKQQSEFESEIRRLKSEAEDQLAGVQRTHEAALSSIERQNSVLKSDKAELTHKTERLQQSVSDSEEIIRELRIEIDELRSRLKSTAEQLADAHAQLAADREGSERLTTTIQTLQDELDALREQLRVSVEALDKARNKIYKFKVAYGFEKIEQVIWTSRVIGFVSGFYQWRAIAHEGAMQRGAAELRDIVDTVDTTGPAPNLDDFHIEAFDVADFAAANFGL